MTIFQMWANGWQQIKDGLNNIFSGNIILDIINLILSGVLAVVEQFLNMLGLNFSIPADIFEGLSDITRGIGYLIPINKFVPLVVFALAFYVGRVIMSVYNRVAHTTIRHTKIIK